MRRAACEDFARDGKPVRERCRDCVRELMRPREHEALPPRDEDGGEIAAQGGRRGMGERVPCLLRGEGLRERRGDAVEALLDALTAFPFLEQAGEVRQPHLVVA